MKLPSGVVSLDVMVSARVVPCCGELASVVAGCIEAVISPSGKECQVSRKSQPWGRKSPLQYVHPV